MQGTCRRQLRVENSYACRHVARWVRTVIYMQPVLVLHRELRSRSNNGLQKKRLVFVSCSCLSGTSACEFSSPNRALPVWPQVWRWQLASRRRCFSNCDPSASVSFLWRKQRVYHRMFHFHNVQITAFWGLTLCKPSLYESMLHTTLHACLAL